MHTKNQVRRLSFAKYKQISTHKYTALCFNLVTLLFVSVDKFHSTKHV